MYLDVIQDIMVNYRSSYNKLTLGVTIFLLITSYSIKTLVLTIIFSLIGFVVIPSISKFVGCKNCEIKDDCPWMTFNKQHSC